MKRFLPYAVFLFVSSASAQVLAINQFSGINTDDSPLTLQNGQSPDSRNLTTDDGPGVQGRKGFVRFSTEPSSALFEFPLSNGTRYLITRSAGNLKATTDGTFSVFIGTVPTDRVVAGAVLGDKFFYSDTLNGLKYWDGSSVTTSSRTLTFDKLATFKGRLVGAGKSGSERILFLSKYLDGTTFALATNPSEDDPAQLTVSGSLDEVIQALYSTFQDKLIYFKKNSFGGLSGSRRSNFALRVYSDSIGVSSVETIRDCDGKLRWLGNNRKVYQYDGATFGTISEDIDNIFANVSQGDANSRSSSLDSQTDFEAGSQSPTGFAYTAIYAGSLTPGATQVSYGTTADFSTGTYSSYSNFADTTTIPGSIRTIWPDDFNSFRDGTSGTVRAWGTYAFSSGSTTFSTSGGTGTLTAGAGATFGFLSDQIGSGYPVSYGTSFYFNIPSATIGAGIAFGITDSPSQLIGTTGHGLYYSDATGTTNDSVAAANTILNHPSSSITYPADIYLYVATNYYTLTVNSSLLSSGTVTLASIALDNAQAYGQIRVQSSTMTFSQYGVAPQTFTYLSNVYNTKLATGAFHWDVFSSSRSSSGIAQLSEVSSDGITWDAGVAATSGSVLTSALKPYARIRNIFGQTNSTNSVLQLDDFSYGGYSTGTWTSAAVDFGTAITSMGAVSFNDSKTSGSDITYQFQNSSNSSTSLFLSTNWVTIANGAVPSLTSVQRYGAVRSSFTVTESTHIAMLNAVTFGWTEGSNIHAASAYINSRYWLGLAISSTSNNGVLVFDKQNQWQRYDGYVPEVMSLYNSRMYVGNTNGIFLSESSYADNGTPITAYYTTKTFAPATFDYYGQYDHLYLTTDNSDDTLTPTFQINNNTTDNSFGTAAMNTTTGIQNLKYPFSMAEVQQGKFINMKWSVVGSSFWRILNGNLYFTPSATPD